MQCPDPEATIDVVFSYEVLGDSSRSLFNELRYHQAHEACSTLSVFSRTYLKSTSKRTNSADWRNRT